MTPTCVLTEVFGKKSLAILNACAKVYPHVRTLLEEKPRAKPPGGGGAILCSVGAERGKAVRSIGLSVEALRNHARMIKNILLCPDLMHTAL